MIVRDWLSAPDAHGRYIFPILYHSWSVCIMKMTDRRESANVEDRRSGRKAKVAAGGLGGVGVVGLLLYFVLSGGNMSPEVVAQLSGNNNGGNAAADNGGPVQTTDSAYYKNNADFANEEELKRFTSQVLASTEDIWTEIFKKSGKTWSYFPKKQTPAAARLSQTWGLSIVPSIKQSISILASSRR